MKVTAILVVSEAILEKAVSEQQEKTPERMKEKVVSLAQTQYSTVTKATMV